MSRRPQQHLPIHHAGRASTSDPAVPPVPGAGRAGPGGRPARRLGYAGPSVLPIDRIRNFSIISHVDHGKSTLSDRILELTGAVDPAYARAVPRLDGHRAGAGDHHQGPERAGAVGDHILHLIDTPGHVDFGYEVSRSLAACEGAVLLVDASQGIQAQTLANCYQALENDLEIVAVLNKIDLPAADPERCAAEIEQVLGIDASTSSTSRPRRARGCPSCSTPSWTASRTRPAIPTPRSGPSSSTRPTTSTGAWSARSG